MASGLDLKLVVKHLTNGSFGENLCRVCLAPLTEFCENIFTTICKEGKEYCVADVLKELCDLQISASDHYNVCPDCFNAATNAYKFYINTRANDEILHYYVDELERHLQSIDVPNDIKAESLCISLPVVINDSFDYDIKDIYCNKQVLQVPCNKVAPVLKKIEPVMIPKIKKEIKVETTPKRKVEVKKVQDDDEIVIVMNEKSQPSFFKLLPDGSLVKRDYDERCRKALEAIPKQEQTAKKNRRKREPMTTKKCFRCSIRYRFIAKLKEHMRSEHGVVLFACKICEALTEDEEEYEFHKKTHTNIYECDTCNVKFKKRETMLDHLKDHKETGNGSLLKADYVCKTCGLIFPDADTLRSHTDLKHYKKYACYYCGRTYKGVTSLEKHVKKHEMYQKQEEKLKQLKKPSLSSTEVQQLIGQRSGASVASASATRLTCELCGRGFRGERALLWHTRLHNNERPFKCDTCGRAFVSLNRRNQHAACAHRAPARRCPLCPALFHLRSMVNTHIKKVHLRAHKRRTRTVRTANVHWDTAPVPVQELAVALQGDVLQLQAARDQQEQIYLPEGDALLISAPRSTYMSFVKSE